MTIKKNNIINTPEHPTDCVELDPKKINQDYLDYTNEQKMYPRPNDIKINMVPQGWQCPICKQILNPNISSCPNCQPQLPKPYTQPCNPPEFPQQPPYPNYPYYTNPVWLNDPCDFPSFTCIVKKNNDTPADYPEPKQQLYPEI